MARNDEEFNIGIVGSVGAWRGRKRAKKALRGSRTPGNTKGQHCMAKPLDKYMAKSSRSYKHPGYDTWRASHSGRKGTTT